MNVSANGNSMADATAIAEADNELLAKLEHGRSAYARRGRTEVIDLALRLREAVEWCVRYADRQTPGTCLRRAKIAPRSLAQSRWEAVEDVSEGRRSELGAVASSRIPPGRALVYFPDANLSDGAAEAETDGFLDAHNAPPWGTWVGYFEEERPGDSCRSKYLISWIPEDLVELVSWGVEVNPEECIAWLDDVDLQLGPIFERIRILRW